MSVFPISVNGSIFQTNSTNHINKINSNTPNVFSVTPQDDLIYNITTLNYNGSYAYNFNDSYGNPAGQLAQGNKLGFNFQLSGNNGTYDYVNGSIRSTALHSNIQDQYFFVDPANSTNLNMGPPLLYFVIPTNSNFTGIASNFTSANYIASYSSTKNFLEISYSWYSSSNSFSKIGGTSVVDNSYVDIVWNTLTGVMQHYFYNYTSLPTTSFQLDFLGDVNVGSFMPFFGYHDAAIFYSITTLQFNSNNTFYMNQNSSQNNPQTYGFIQQGQNALVSIHTNMSMNNGPSYNGRMNTLTGSASIESPFGNNNNNNNNNGGGPPDLIFLIPVAQNSGWWGNISLELSLMGLNKLAETTGTITFQQFDPNNNANSVSFTFNKTTGLLINYNLSITNAVPSTGLGFTGSLHLQLNLLKAYEMTTFYPYYAISQGDQYRYHINVLNVNGSTTESVSAGSFQQGQDIDILYNNLLVNNNGPQASITLSTVSGQTSNNLNYDIFSHQDGPALFLPILPINSTTHMYQYFGDVFHYIAGAVITNNATVFGFSITNLKNPDMTINNLAVYWNKTNGLMLSYNFDAVNPNDSGQYMKLQLSFVGNSKGQQLYTAPTSSTNTSSNNTQTISAPGFDLLIFSVAVVPILVYARKRKIQ